MATYKQKAAVSKILENPGMSISGAMRSVGYSENTVVNPSDLTNSKGWQELMEEFLPDTKLLKVHERGLEAKKVITSHTEPDRVIDDVPTQLKAVELGYKIKGKLSPEVAVQVNNYTDTTKDQKEKYGIK